jgi:hypothetical protein
VLAQAENEQDRLAVRPAHGLMLETAFNDRLGWRLMQQRECLGRSG